MASSHIILFIASIPGTLYPVTHRPSGCKAFQASTVQVEKIPIYVDGIEVTAIDLSQSNIPQRFACPDYVVWSPELTNICVTYPNFPAWVKEPEFSDVEKLWEYNPKQTGNTEVVK